MTLPISPREEQTRAELRALRESAARAPEVLRASLLVARAQQRAQRALDLLERPGVAEALRELVAAAEARESAEEEKAA